MQLKITQEILNLSFNDKNLEEIENSQENPQYFRKSSKKLASKYFEDPQNILRILTLKIFWGKNLQY